MEEDEFLDMEEQTTEEAVDVPMEEISTEGQVNHYVFDRFCRARDVKRTDETRALTAYRNFRGENPPDMEFRENTSQIFIKITKTKVLAATEQLCGVLFGGMRFPISVEPTKLPEGVSESVHFDPQKPPEGGAPQQEGDQQSQQLLPGETHQQKKVRLGSLEKKLAPIKGELKEGTGNTPSALTWHPAMEAAKKMEKKIQDQLEECDASKELRYAAFECALFGTMIMKGPFAVDKEYPDWDEKGNYTPTIKTMPQASYVSFWNFYPDPDALNMKDAEYVVERHKMSRSQLRDLKNRPYFDEDKIEEVIEDGENYVEQWWESQVTDRMQRPDIERFEVLEYWGHIDAKLVEDFGINIPKEMREKRQLSANIWTCNGRVIRCVLNPFKPAYIPYYATPYEVNPYSFFGVGVAENMEDTQDMMNVFMRMGIDNAALSGNLVFEIDEDALAPGESLEFYPGKTYRRQGGAPGQAIFSHQFQNVSAQNMQMFEIARRLADEATGLPSFAHGQTGVQGIGRTASGISMLMSAASGSIRQVVKNVDDFLLSQIGKAFFRFNMQFDFDPDIRGDLEVKARGTESFMANEVRSQRLMQFLQVVAGNPATAPFGKMEYIIHEIAKSMELDPEKVVNSLQDAQLYAMLMQQFTAQAGGGVGQGQGASTPGMSPMDTQGSGGGTIGTGSAPGPGMEGFSGNQQ